MAHNTQLNTGVGGDTILNVDMSLNTYPSTGKLPASCLYVSPNNTTAPTPVTDTNPLPVDGTVTANLSDVDNAVLDTIAASLAGTLTVASHNVTNAGTFSVQVSNSVSVTGTFWQATQPVSLASVPSHHVTNAGTFAVQVSALPAGLATSANQDTIIDGLASIDSKINTCNTSAVVVSSSVLPTGASTSDKQDTGNVSLAAIDTKITTCNTGAVVLAAGTAGIGKLTANSGIVIGSIEVAANQTLSTVTTIGTVTNLSQLGGSAIAMNTGTRSAGTQRVTIATDDIVPASQSGTWTVQPGNTTNTTPWLVTDKPVTSGGLSTYSFLSTNAVQSANIKSSAGMLYSVEFFNVSATPVFVRVYNKATTDDGSGTPIERWMIPGNTAGAGFVKEWVKGIECSSGITIRVTSAIADSDSTALTANTILGNIEYK